MSQTYDDSDESYWSGNRINLQQECESIVICAKFLKYVQ